MAFHVACPITCRKICFCLLGFPRNLHGREVKDVFLNEIHSLQEVLRDPWDVGVSNEGTVQIHVPKLDILDTGPHIAARDVTVMDGSVMEAAASSLSTLAKRTVLHKKEAESQAANSCSGDLAVSFKEFNGEDDGHHGASITCHMCYLVEVERSERAARMLSCKSCGKKYHRSCVKPWAKHRDLFNWSSWSCPSCRTCEACGNTGDPKKLMFCKRCDDAYHCDCQQPRHKNASSGPYLCPKHTKCFSCGSTVPGNGLSLRWFLGHTCCDACGRLFVKGNYCPVCLKVYRDSESTPMVCCDFCQRWVHCHCDGISDEKYLRFQVDGNLQYKCSTCRGECYQIKDLDDAVQEIWKRKDMADKELIASLRASAGFPTEAKMLSASPSSDDGINGSFARRSSKPIIKVLADRSQNSSTKKHSKKKASRPHGASKSEVQHDCGGSNYAKSNGYGSELGLQEKSARFARIAGHTEGTPPINQLGFLKGKDADKVMVSGEEEKPLRVLRIKSSRPQDSDIKNCGNHATESNTVKAKKLVISIGPRNARVANPLSSSDISKFASNGKHGKQQSEETVPQERQPSLLGKNNEEKRAPQAKEVTSKGEIVYTRRHSESKVEQQGELRNDHNGPHGLQKDSRCFLKLKIKKHNPESQNGETPARSTVDEKASSAKGHRSKRKRASPPMEKSAFNEDEDISLSREDSLLDEMLDASWILKKLGKDAKGKKVQIHEASENTWEKGVVSEVAGGSGTSKLMVTLENGEVKTVELGKQGVRFVPQKQKRTKT